MTGVATISRESNTEKFRPQSLMNDQQPPLSKMPKRTREDEAKAPPLSALAARRLRSQEATPPEPKTPENKKKAIKVSSTSKNAGPRLIVTATAANSESENVEDLIAKRREIEEQLKDQLRAQAQARPALGYDGAGTEESALSRVRRKSGEITSVAVTPTDDEMVDVSELAELRSEDEDKERELQAQVNLSYSGESSIPKLVQVSSFMPTEHNYGPATDNGHTIFRMISGETIVLLGEYNLQVTKGTITVAGATLTQSSGVQTIYAPSTQSLPVIECGDKKGKKGEKRNGAIGDFDTEILISSSKLNSGLRDIGKLCPMFSGIWNLPGSSRRSEGAETFFPLYSTTYNIPTLSTPKSWKSTLDAISQKLSIGSSSFSSTTPPVIVITGSKGTGKSTFARTLVNNILTSPTSTSTSVAYLDVDPGQPEFSPPGFLSLHRLTTPILGPPFTHPNPTTTLRSHYIGYASPREDPGHYIRAIINLITLYRDLLASATTPEEARTPLIINTAGWTKGLGLELLTDILAQSQASDIVFLSGALERSNPVAEIIPEWATLHGLESISSTTPSRFSAADLRMLQIMSYLHHNPEKEKWDFGTPLTNVPPWVVPYTGPAPGVDAVAVLGEQVDPSELVTAIEGTLVGVVLVEEDSFGELIYTDEKLPYLCDAPLSLAPENSFSAGLALIRGVDVKEECLQILTSIEEDKMERWEKEGLKVVLVRGRLELPVWEMVGAGVEGAPWVAVGAVVGREGKGGEVWRVRRNVMRRGQQMRGE